MTIDLSDNSPRVSYDVADGVTQSSFTVSFEFFDNDDLNVYVDGVLKTITTDYTVAGGDGSTGTITMSVTGASGGSKVVITRSIDLERTTDFPTSGPFNIASLNTELDRFVAISADLKDQADRALQLTDYDAAASLTLPDVDTRKGKTLAFNESTGAVEAGPSISNVQSVSAASADIATLADIEDGTVATDTIQTVAGISANVTTVASISANVTTVAGISSDVTAVAGDEADIGTVSTNIADVNTVAGISSDVTTVAGNTSNINTVAGNNANVTAVGGISADVTTVAGISSDVTTVAADGTDIGTVATNISNVNTVAGISGSVTTVAGISSDVASVAGDATDIGTVATNIASVNTTATNISSINTNTANITAIQNAATNAATATTKASEASTSATNAATSETNASSSASAAAASAAAAAASADTFDDTYLGSKASDPSVDNDGDALTAGDLYFNTTDNKLKVYSGSAWQSAALDSSGFVETTGDTMTGDLSFGDNDKAIFGAGSDLQIYHDGSDSIINDSGTGNLFIRGTSTIVLGGVTSNNVLINDGADVKLRYNSADKLATTSTGIDVTGTVTADGLTVDGKGTFTKNQTADTAVEVSNLGIAGANTTSSFIVSETVGSPKGWFRRYRDGTGTTAVGFSDKLVLEGEIGSTPTNRMEIASTGDISFYEDTGTTAKFFWDASAESLGIGTSSPSSYWASADDLVVATSGNTGISVVSGTTSLGYLIFADSTAGGDNTRGGLGYDHSTDNMLFRVNNDTKMRIDSSGNVGIGTSSPSRNLEVHSSTGGNAYISAKRDNATSTELTLGAENGNTLLSSVGAIPMAFYTNGSERMRIDSSGNLLVGTTSINPVGENSVGHNLSHADGRVQHSTNGNTVMKTNQTSDGDTIQFRKDGTTVGSVSVTGSTTSYNTSSDYRLKEDVQPMTGASARVQSLKPCNFAWKVDGSRTDGFLAHEAQAVVPEAVTGEKDGEEMQAIDQSKLVPLLTAALQEALTKIDALEARITTLEG